MILRNKLLKRKTKAGSSLLRLCLPVQKHSWKPDSVVNTIYFSAEAVTPAHGPADNRELDKMFRLKYSNVTPDKPHDCSYEVTREHARGEPHHTGTHAEGRKCASELQQRRWWQLYVRGSESSAHPALRFKTTFQKTRWQKPKFSSNVSHLCLWNVLCLHIWEMLLLCWSHADARPATLLVVAFSCTGSTWCHSAGLQPSVTDFVPMRQTTVWRWPAPVWK